MTGRSVERVRQYWGAALPDWIETLAEACDATSQNKVAAHIGYSAATVSCVIGNRYTGDMVAVRQAVEGALLRTFVNCPVLGELRADRCLAEQRKPLSASNPQRVRLYRACRAGCPHSRLQRKETDR